LAEAKDFQFLRGPVLHGVGIMNYEMPYFIFPYQDKGRPEIIESGMVVSVSNIGLFSDRGWGGWIEDMALITEDESIYLTHFPKELIRV